MQIAYDRGCDLTPLIGPVPDIRTAAQRIRLLEPGRRAAVVGQLSKMIGGRGRGSADDVRALARAGFEIGFHTVRHDSLTQLDDDQLDRAMEHGRARLEELVGRRLVTIAYPHGKADARVAAAARAAGFRTGYTTRPTPVGDESDPLLLGRIEAPRASLRAFATSLVRTLAA